MHSIYYIQKILSFNIKKFIVIKNYYNGKVIKNACIKDNLYPFRNIPQGK